MFTGLVDDIGTVERISEDGRGRVLRIATAYDKLSQGESVSVSGVCLTVVDADPGWFDVAAVATTLERTIIGRWQVGYRVNLERALRVGERLGGHFVQGHVDGVAEVKDVRTHGEAILVDLALPPGLADLMVPRGSLAVDGVSLTVNELPAPDVAQVSLIEYTRRHTTLAALAEGALVHVEADIIGKHVQRLLAAYAARG